MPVDRRVIEALHLESEHGDRPPPAPQVEVVRKARPRSAAGPTRATGAPKQVGEVLVTRFSTVEPRPLSWLWRHRIPLGMVTILAGDGGLGKSTVALDVAARVSTGRPMPDDSEGLGELAGVVVLSSEDDLASVIVPRLMLAGADLARIATVAVKTPEEERPLLITPGDLARLDGAVRELGARFVILDPLASFVDEQTNLHHYQDARRVLARLHGLAEARAIAVLGIHHFNRGQHQDAAHRLTGSLGIGNAARSVLVVGPDPEDPTGERMVLALAKRNLAPRSTPSLAYRLAVPDGGEHPAVVWEGECAAAANDLVAATTDPEERSERRQADDWLRQALAGGPRRASAAEAIGFSDKVMRGARRRVGVDADREQVPGKGRIGCWWWRLHRSPPDPWPWDAPEPPAPQESGRLADWPSGAISNELPTGPGAQAPRRPHGEDCPHAPEPAAEDRKPEEAPPEPTTCPDCGAGPESWQRWLDSGAITCRALLPTGRTCHGWVRRPAEPPDGEGPPAPEEPSATPALTQAYGWQPVADAGEGAPR